MGLRQDRLADQIRDLVGECFQGGHLSDPRLQGVTITAVKLSSDLQIATVYFRIFDETPEKEVRQGLQGASGFFRKRLAKALDVRRVPELRYFYDESVERASRIEDLLRDL